MAPAAEVKAEEPLIAPPVPEEKREPHPVPPPVPERPKRAVVKPKVPPIKPAPVPRSESRTVATQPRESLPVAAEATIPAAASETPSAPPAANLLAAKSDHIPEPPTAQTAPGPLQDVTFGQGSGPSFAQRIMPEYPWQERRRGNQGKVVLRLHISRQGTLENVEIVESGGPLFDKASLQAVRASSYRPAMVQGTSVASTALLPIKFNLENVPDTKRVLKQLDV